MVDEPGLDWTTVQRLVDLEGTKQWLIAHGDRYKLLSSVIAIMAAYRAKKLSWIPGRVTFWSFGRKLSEPKPFDWSEFGRLSEKHGGSQGLWVEGVCYSLHKLDCEY